MKLKFCLTLLLTVSFAYLNTGCVEYASGYKRIGGGGGGGADASPEDEGSGEDTGDEGSDEGSDEGEGEDTGDSGDETAVSLLSTCEGCHSEGSEAAGVTLDSQLIPRLKDAIEGSKKDKHLPFEENFKEPLRADLEAELSALGLRLKGK